ncbi:MAG: hypothetical protein WC005_08110 [Candidatus Nanopelagicales bacterium]
MNAHRTKVIAAAGLSSIMLVSTATAAFAAEATPTPSPTATATPHPSGTATPRPDKTKLTQRIARAEARHAINETFYTAMQKARTDAQAQLAVATTKEARQAVRATHKAAVEAAVAARQAAMTALIPGWTPHTKPVAG